MTGSGSLFSSVIEDHLALKRQNSRLDGGMPIDELKNLFAAPLDLRLQRTHPPMILR